MLRHHLDPVNGLFDYDTSRFVVPSRPDLDALDNQAMSDTGVLTSIARANELPAVDLSDREIGQLIEFLHALTDPAMLDMRADVPASLPSGMPLAD